ncbi:spore wall protein 1 [Encephalitozoon hellem]|uniref:Spore wall protein 1 n=1 Tax=Encephalitozoon hellem TaxID=27973 RepID=A0A9Q9C5R4_ENCHE|nr:spore wall protein 1 [Encephalitozoon hellem]
MLKLSLLLGLANFTAILAGGERRRSGLLQCSANGSRYFREQNLLGIKYKDDVKRLCGERPEGPHPSESSSCSSSCSEECGRRRFPGIRDDCEYSSWDACCSSSWDECTDSTPCTTPTPLRCDAELRVPIINMGERIYEFLKNYEDQYESAVTLALNNILSQVSGFNPIFAGADYAALVEQLETLGVNVPANTAAELASIDSSESAALSRIIQGNAQKIISDLFARVGSMCYSDITSLINSGLFASQISSAFSNTQPVITIASNDLYAKQMAVFQRIPGTLPAAAVTAITNALQTNRNNFATFFTTQATTLQTNVQNILTALTTALTTLTNSTSTEFTTFANSEIAALAARIFPATTASGDNNSGSTGGDDTGDEGDGGEEEESPEEEEESRKQRSIQKPKKGLRNKRQTLPVYPDRESPKAILTALLNTIKEEGEKLGKAAMKEVMDAVKSEADTKKTETVEDILNKVKDEVDTKKTETVTEIMDKVKTEADGKKADTVTEIMNEVKTEGETEVDKIVKEFIEEAKTAYEEKE